MRLSRCVDVTSFVVLEQRGIESAFADDADFVSPGFTLAGSQSDHPEQPGRGAGIDTLPPAGPVHRSR